VTTIDFLMGIDLTLVVGGDHGPLRTYLLDGTKAETYDAYGYCISVVCSKTGNVIAAAFPTGLIKVYFVLGSEKASDLDAEFVHDGRYFFKYHL